MNEIFGFLKRFERFTKNSDLMVAFGLIIVMVVMVMPLPAFFLDLLLTASITLSVLILLVSLYTERALDFSVFPTLLLVSTLFRLALNVATTRIILTEGHNGAASAGAVIEAFAGFVVGNNYFVGFVVFVILVVINFVVITKGSGRVAEVAARFTLDAMPGKQMSIDADLNAGLINEDQARTRRREIESEADFYGAMDGASKFVRGDAIAGIIIMIVNVVGGLIVGVLQKGLGVQEAAEIYTRLTIGDGLVAQIPALIISVAAGTVVTRNSSGKNMGKEVVSQLTLSPRALMITGGVLGFLGVIPGLPKAPFLLTSAFLGGLGWFLERYRTEKKTAEKKAAEDLANKPEKEKIESLLSLDRLEIEVGYGLINVVESGESGDLLERIVSIRKQFALDQGIIVPSVHIRDNLQLEPGEYRIMIEGTKVGGGTMLPEYLLAMDPGNVAGSVEGIPTREPAFGLDALWIPKSRKEEAELAGYTVVELPTVMATHLTEVIRQNMHQLLGRQEASQLIDNFKKTHPKVVDEVIPELLSFGAVVRVLQNLLREGLSIRNLLTIFEALADEAPKNKDVEVLTEAVRKSLSRYITSKFMVEDGSVPVMSLDPHIEETVAGSLIQTEQGVQLVMDPRTAQALITQIARTIEAHPEFAGQPILLTSPTVRRHIRKLTERFIPQLSVISHSELSHEARVSSVGVVELRDAG